MSMYSDKTPVLLLKCDGIDEASPAAIAIVEGMMKSVIYDFGDIVEDGVVNSFMDESYATKAYDVLESQCEEAGFDDAVEAAAVEAENLMSKLMVQNYHELHVMSSAWVVDEVAVLKRLPNLWVVQVFGSRFPY